MKKCEETNKQDDFISPLWVVSQHKFITNDNKFKIKGFYLTDNYVFDNGGREKLLNNNGLSISQINNYLNDL